jgi:hypothetical protein
MQRRFGWQIFRWMSIDFSLLMTAGAVSALAIDPITPQTVYAGTYGGGVFRLISKSDIDFNDDKKPDILWRNSNSGQNVVGHMSGTIPICGVSLPDVSDRS